jgi:hypothetical protein
MSYGKGNEIRATDLNAFIGSNPTTAANTLNTVWSTGGSAAGYGQTAVPTVSVGGEIYASNWGNLITKTSNAASHQGSSITSVSVPAVGSEVTYLSAIPTNLATIYSNRLNAASQSSTSSVPVTFNSIWNNSLTFTFSATFANGDAARYFFNSGGQLAFTCSHPSGTGFNATVSQLASNIGTVVMSSPTSGTATVSGTSYTGITKVGGGGNAPSPYLVNNGYFALTTANANVFTQTASGGSYVSYLGTNIKFLVKSNGTQGTNGDAGSVVTVYCVWSEVPTGVALTSGTVTTLTMKPPETTYVANTWGAISLSGTVAGS